MNRTKVILAGYAAAASADLLAIVNNMADVRLISKSVLMPILMIYVFQKTNNQKSPLFYYLLGALVLSWLGDLFLLFDTGDSMYFIFGLASFLLAHLTYIILNVKTRIPGRDVGLLTTQQMRYLFILVLAGSAVIYVLFPHLGDLKIPVIIYAIALTYMAISALYRYGRASTRSFSLVFLGALLFMLSDSMLAINKFVDSFSYAGFWVMLTYTSAQYLIAEGFVTYINDRE